MPQIEMAGGGNGGGFGNLKNVITVSPSGGDFTSIKDANDSITDSSKTNQYVIEVGPGDYTLAPVVCKNYVDIKALGSNFSTRLTASDPNSPLFTGAGLNKISGFSITGVTNSAAFLVDTAGHAMTILECTIYGCKYGIWATGGLATAHNIGTAPLGTMEKMFYASGGDIQVTWCAVQGNATITTYAHCDSPNSDLHIISFLLYAPNVVTAFYCENGGEIEVMEGFAKELGTAFKVDDDSVIIAGNVVVEDSVTTHVEILHLDSIFQFTAGRLNRDRMSIVAGYQDGILMFVDNKEDDEGVAVWGELAVGRPEKGDETVMGEGDSYTRGMLVYTYNPAGAVWTDASTAARSASGSTFTFPAIAQDNAIYVASSLQNGGDYLQHYGIKLNCTIAAVLGGGSIACEYWTGAAWVAIDQMSTMSGSPYTQYANDLFIRVQSEQLRYPKAFLAAWAKNDPGMGLGTNYFWIRYRIATAVTTAPTFQQWKLHTNRFEVNADGVTEYFGAARYTKDLLVHIALNDPVTGAAPGNSAVDFSATIELTIDRNRFNNNAVDAFGEVVIIPNGIDTSIPVTIETVWYADTANAGDVELVAYFAELEVGDLWNGTHAESTVTQVETVGAGTRYVSRKTSFDIDIADLVPGELLVFKIQRDATNPNDPPDTLAGNIIFGSVRAFGTFWRP